MRTSLKFTMINRILIVFSLLMNVYLLAAGMPPPDSGDGGGTGGVGGALSPIDMYVYLLAGFAILFILYFVKRQRKVI